MSTPSIKIGNRFEIGDLQHDLIGRGGMGDVYRGMDTQTGQAVAIKALRPEAVAANPDLVARFLREGEALRQLNHPNIVQMVDAVEDTGRHYLVLEYVEGGSLRDLLDREGKLSSERTLGIALEVADALTRAHHLGVVHRDLKPGNVLLAEDGTPRLTDFGIAYLPDTPRLTQSDVLIGTVDYLSPEVCNGEVPDTRADIWSFGVMLYEMLAGTTPFADKVLTNVLLAILTQPVPDLEALCPDAPVALVDLIYRMLEKERAARIPSVRLVGAKLEAVSEGHKLGPAAQPEGVQADGRQVSSQEQPRPTSTRFATPTPSAEILVRHNLPVQTTPFVGREAELAELDRLLADPGTRLVTVLGSGGMGKTRLGLRAAEMQLNRFANGVFFCSLAPLRSVETIVPTIAEALGFSFYQGGAPRRQLLDYLREKQMLLLLDNYEHLLDGVDIATDILRTAPEVRVLATSRARLNVQGEQLYHLTGMDFPDWETPEDALEYTAVKLFMQSARRVRPGFELQADDLKYVSRICRLVQGMPLGILLAAAWIEMLTPREIAAEIGQGLDFLETDLHDVPERQRSIRAVFDHSWNLLTEREREVFQGLSVFRGGFTREAVQRVTGVSLRELMSLVNKSLLQRTPAGRYEVHELLRQYAGEHLDRSPDAGKAVRDRHSAHYVDVLERWAVDAKGERHRVALKEMDLEIENARAAWNWAVERGYVEQLDRVVFGLHYFYYLRRRHQEGADALGKAAGKLTAIWERPEGAGQSRASRLAARVLITILSWKSTCHRDLGQRALARQCMEQGQSILESTDFAGQDVRFERALFVREMGFVAGYTDLARAIRLHEQSLALFQEIGEQWYVGASLRALGWSYSRLGQYDKGRQWIEESRAFYRALGDQAGSARSAWMLSRAHLLQGQIEQAERLARESLSTYRELDRRVDIGETLALLGAVLWYAGKFLEIQPLMDECLAICSDLGLSSDEPSIVLGATDFHLGHYGRVRTLIEEHLAFVRSARHTRHIVMSFDVLGLVALAEGAHTEARQWLQESITLCQDLKTQNASGIVHADLGYVARGITFARRCK